MGDRGTGPVLTTVVFVDVEASTDMIDRIGDDAGLGSVGSPLGVVLERGEAYGGRVARSTGDGLVLTFLSPRQAVSFALAALRALAGSARRLRIGIDMGEVIAAEADPLGSTVNVAARIAGRAAGGEVLVSDVVRQLVGTLPSLRFGDRGHCRLKGFPERWHLWAAEDSTTEQDSAATVGRIAELAALAELVSSTAAGVGRVLLLEGEAGIGKTHLVREATTQARRAGIAVVEVSSDELVHRPGAVPHRLLDAARPGLVSRSRLSELLNGPPGRVALGEDFSYLVVEASVDLVEEMSRHDRLLVAAEDLHWADDLSLAVLIALVRRSPVSPFAVIASLRPSPCPPALDRLVETVQDGAGRHIRLGGLDDIDVHALASMLTGAAPGERLQQRLLATAGNPLFATELLRSFDDDNLLRVESGVVDVTVDDTPTSLHKTLVRRLSWLPQETNELLRLASLLGNTFTLHDLAAITGRAVIDIAAWLREASLAGLIVGDTDRLAFRHDLIREAMYGHMLPAERRDLHRAAGQALAQAGAPIQQIAQQYARGALPGDLEAVTWLERAADETISLSPSSAITLLQDAVSLTPLQSPRRAALQARTIEPLALCGRYRDAEAIAETVLATASDPNVEYTALRGLRVVAFGHGDAAAELAILRRASAAAGAPADEAQRLRCFVALLSMVTGATSVDSARQFAEDTLAQAVATHDAPTQTAAHQTLGIIATLNGYGFVGRDHLTAAIALLDAGLPMSDLYAVSLDTFHVLGLLEVDAIDEAIAAADKARQRAEQLGALAQLPGSHLAAAAARLCTGHWDDALAEIEAGQAVVDDTGNQFFGLYYDAVVARVAIHRGDLATAHNRLKAGIRRFADRPSHTFGADWLFGAQAEYLAATGQPEAALAAAETTWTKTAHTRYVYGHRGRGILLVRLAVAAARDDLADDVTVELEEGARRCPTASAIATARQCRGLVQRDPDQLLEAVARYRTTPLRPDLAACCEDAAGLLAASGRRDEAIELLHEAATIHTDINAGADATRVDATLGKFGERRRRPRASRPTFGWESLTSMESDVSRLAAEGLTNPEIGARLYISRRTVETHLSHVYRKLGLPSRTHLCAELTRRAPSP